MIAHYLFMAVFIAAAHK